MSKRLLIVIDSEPVTSRTLALDLAEAGYRVETARDGKEAEQKFEAIPFDLLIAAEGDEHEKGIVARMQRLRPAAKVVLMTTGAGDASGGGDSIVRVQKPFDLEEFRSLIERLLDRRATGSAN